MSWTCECGYNNSVGHSDCTKCGSTPLDRAEARIKKLQELFIKIRAKVKRHGIYADILSDLSEGANNDRLCYPSITRVKPYTMDLRAWDDRIQKWVFCSSLNYDYERKLWRYIQQWTDGDEDWLYDIEINVDGKWHKLNDKKV